MSNRALLLTIALSLAAFPVLLLAQSDNQPVSPMTDQSFDGSRTPFSVGTISGSVNTMDGRPLDQARVELRDISTGTVLGHTYTRTNGSFELYNIRKGMYEVVATKGVVETRERVDLAVSDGIVNLRMSNPVNDGGVSGGSTVSVSQYKVSPKARKEFEKADKAFHEGKLDEAKSKAAKALEIYPQFAEALTLRGILEVNEKNYPAGEADLQEAIKYDPNYAMAYFAMGAALNLTGKYEDALRALDRGVSLKPDGWQGFFEMAKANLAKRDFKTALKNVEQAQKLSNDVYAPLHVVKAHALMGVKDYQAAVAELELYLNREPQGDIAASARKTLDQAKSFVAAGPNARATTTAGTQ